jgi:hypothetical protein
MLPARILNCVVDAGRDREVAGGGERLIDAIIGAKPDWDAAQTLGNSERRAVTHEPQENPA